MSPTNSTSRQWNGGAKPWARTPQVEWADGYVVDTPYFEPVLTDVCPAWLSLVAVLHGQPPLDTSKPLTWLDLGAASGISACMVAAGNPNVDVWGFDHNPSHVERGRSLAGQAALSNCHFEEASFSDLAADPTIGPPEADVIVVSGVYSWISRQNQLNSADVIRQRLKPGGLAYVMYETPTGWSSMVPVAEALRLLAQADGRRGDLAFRDAAAQILALRDAGALSFPLGPHEGRMADEWSEANGFYAAHEYLGGHFGPVPFDDVTTVMADSRCSYIGQLNTTDHLSTFWAPPALAQLVHGAADVTTRELYRDLIGQRALRRDLYRRGLATRTAAQCQEAITALRIVGSGLGLSGEPVEVLGGGVSIDPAYYEPLVGSLSDKPLNVDTIAEIHTDWSAADAASALALLIAGGYAIPAAPSEPTSDAVAACRRLNQVLVAEARSGADHSVAMSPITGAGIDIDIVGLLALGFLHAGASADVDVLASLAMEDLDRQNRTIRHKGKIIEDRDEAFSVARERVDRMLAIGDRLTL